MTPTHHNPPRNAKRKAESPEADSISTSRPQRKKQKRETSTKKESSPPPSSLSPITSPLTTTKSSALQRHLIGLYNEIQKATDDT
jgi:hypothetical protein